MSLLFSIYAAAVDEPRLIELIDKYWVEMAKVANKILGNNEDAEDAAQQAFLSLLENFDKYRELDDDRAEAALFIITKHKAIDIYRKNKRRVHYSLDECQILSVNLESENPLSMAISSLDDIDRDIIILRYDIGLSIGEIAKALGVSYAATQKRISRAKIRLKELIRG